MSYHPSMADDAVTFPTLDASALAVLETLGTRMPVTAGEYLYQEGDATYDNGENVPFLNALLTPG